MSRTSTRGNRRESGGWRSCRFPRPDFYPGEIDKLWLLTGGVAQAEVIVMARPAQADRPASGGGEIDDRRAGTAGDLPGHGLICAVEGGPGYGVGQMPPG